MADERNSNLLPCPFCGVVPRIDYWPERKELQAYEIQCYTDHCIGPGVMDFTSLKVFTKWNTRVNSFREPAEIAPKTLYAEFEEWWHTQDCGDRASAEAAYVQGRADQSKLLASSTPDSFREWQPIETAPKDGTRILVWWPYWTTKSAIVGWYLDGYWNCAEATTSEGIGPTCWQELPPPPMEVKDEE